MPTLDLHSTVHHRAESQTRKLRLNIGSGKHELKGYVSVDRCFGLEAYPLSYDDETVDEVYASHVLEHFSHRETHLVLADWFRVLKPGGEMYLSVPDFRKISTDDPRWFLYLMGSHSDENDYHKAVFTEESLSIAMQFVGLVNIQQWKSWNKDCSVMPISANLMGIKPRRSS